MQQTHLLFRKIRTHDLNELHQLSQNCGIGVTTLPDDRPWLESQIKRSEHAFSPEITKPHREKYLFVLEDTLEKKVIGVSAIEANVGWDLPFYSYKLVTQSVMCHELEHKQERKILHLVNDFHQCTEVCSLVLMPGYRRYRIGSLLSRGRFLFMAQFKERFGTHIFAEMRGYTNARGHSPFWQAVGNHFFPMNFVEASNYSSVTNKQFIADLMPTQPLYVKLLPSYAQKAIGRLHPDTTPAVKLLQREGFYFGHYFDIFDAGPVLEVPMSHLNTVRQSRVCQINHIKHKLSGGLALVSNNQLDFRAVMTHVLLNHNNEVTLTDLAAKQLQVSQGNQVRVMAVVQ